MASLTSPLEKKPIRYSQSYKDSVLMLSDCIGVSQTAAQLGLKTSLIYSWRYKQKHSNSECVSSLIDENVSLKRQLAEKTEEMEFL